MMRISRTSGRVYKLTRIVEYVSHVANNRIRQPPTNCVGTLYRCRIAHLLENIIFVAPSPVDKEQSFPSHSLPHS
jgi:hypothetical protein